MSAVLKLLRQGQTRPAAPAVPSPAAANAAAASFAALTARLDYLEPAEIEQVRKAYRFADEAHLGQIRASGEPYITHPIAVAAQCAEWKLDAQALMAALLHDAIEDCGVTKPELIERFGAPVAELVDGLTKLDKLQFNTREENQAESFRKMLLAMARDVRVILIKLADRTHNMRTLDDVPREKWTRISLRDAGDLRADRAPAGPEPDLSRTAGAGVPPPAAVALRDPDQGRDQGAQPPARPDPEGAARGRSRLRGSAACRCASPGARRRSIPSTARWTKST